MADGERLGASFSIDVTDLKTGLAQANRLIRESESEFKSAAAGMDDWSSSQEGLNAKIKSLSTITNIQKEKVSALKQEYQNLIDEGLDPTSKEAVELRTKINNEETALKKNEAELQKQVDALGELANQSNDTADEVEDVGDKAEESSGKLDKLKSAGGVLGKALVGVASACVGAVGAFLSLGESTKETQTAMAKLDQSFSSAGLSAEDATNTLTDLYGVVGDMDRANEASNLLAKMSDNTADLEKNTRILTGVFAEYGDSIPTEGLAEGMQATAQMGSVQGVLADALEWQGVNLDDYNEKLEKMSSAEERAAYIQSTLTELYGESADAYRENNKALIESNEAQLQLETGLASIGAVALPIMTELKKIAADLLTTIKPFVELVGEGLTDVLNGSAEGAKKLADGIGGALNVAIEKIVDIIPTLLDVVVAIIPTLVDTIVKAAPTIIDAIVTILPQLTDALLGMLPSLLEACIEIVVSIVNGLAKLFPSLVKQLVQIIPQLITALVGQIPNLLNAAINLLMAIVDAIPIIVTNLLNALPQLYNTIYTTIFNAIPQLLDAATTLFFAIIDALPTIISALVENLPLVISTICTVLTENLPLVLEAAVQMLYAIIQAIPTIINVLIVQLPSIIHTIQNSLLQNIPLLVSAAFKLFMGIVTAIPLIITQLVKQVPSIGKSIIESLKNSLKNIPELGKNLIKGLWNGISDMASWIKQKISGFGDGVLNSLKNFFGIHSPSTVMENVIGKNLALGIGKGFGDNIDGVNDMITDAMQLEDVGFNANINGKNKGGIVINQTNNYSQAHSRLELYKSKKQTAAAVRLAMGV